MPPWIMPKPAGRGRKIDQKDPNKPNVPIIEHADVKRMLLFQRSVSEGAFSLLLQCSKYVDLQKGYKGEKKSGFRPAFRPVDTGGKVLPVRDGHSYD